MSEDPPEYVEIAVDELHEMADEIERLRAAVLRLIEELEKSDAPLGAPQLEAIALAREALGFDGRDDA